ncbi:MAG TPA: sigma-70 family RNA polymerase sigma factor [Candidatus Solibacter sp.]|nr:sigma-70 family RNA polymerase sigma factor [Candidatus Solibacter sp.]
MTTEPMTNRRSRQDREVIESFLDSPSDQSFEKLFDAFTPQLIAFFRSRRCDSSLAEDLAQEVMLTVHRKARQLREREKFRGWLFKIALNAMRVHYVSNKVRDLETVGLDTVANRLAVNDSHQPPDTLPFEFLQWMKFLDSRESEAMKLRFIEDLEYHEIAAVQSIPIGTAQWRIFNAKRKLAPHLDKNQEGMRKAA